MGLLTALGIEVLLKLFLCCCAYATQKSDYRKPDPCGNAQILYIFITASSIGFLTFLNVENISSSAR